MYTNGYYNVTYIYNIQLYIFWANRYSPQALYIICVFLNHLFLFIKTEYCRVGFRIFSLKYITLTKQILVSDRFDQYRLNASYIYGEDLIKFIFMFMAIFLLLPYLL